MLKLKIKNIIYILFVSYILYGCSGVNFSSWHFPYMMEVQQGTYITNKQYQQISVGMTKDQVVFVLGYPLSQYIFDKNRWDFNYQDYMNNNLKKSYKITIYFDNNGNVSKISKIGDELFTS